MLGLGQASDKLQSFHQNFEKIQGEALALSTTLDDWIEDSTVLVKNLHILICCKLILLYF